MLSAALAVLDEKPTSRQNSGRHSPSIVLRHVNSAINNLKNISADQVPLAEHANTGTVTLEQLAVLDNLLQLHLGQLHEAVDLVLRPLKVFYAKSIDRNDLDARFVAKFEHLS